MIDEWAGSRCILLNARDWIFPKEPQGPHQPSPHGGEQVITCSPAKGWCELPEGL